MRARRIILGIAAGAACFALGVAAARWFGASGPSPATMGPPQDAGVSLFPADAGPRIFIDLDASIQLLPDASLHLDLPNGPDAGAP